MQETQQTFMSNSHYDLVSLLYHALQEAQSCSAYIRDAEQEGQQELAQFFRTTQHEANRRALHIQHLLDQHRFASASGTSVSNTPHQTGNYPGHYQMGMQSTST